MKRNYLGSDLEQKNSLIKVFEEQILINLRTYDVTSLILYANDHLNNFILLYLDNGTEVVYLFNHGNVIRGITVDYNELNTSKSVQIAIQRNENSTTLYVNDQNATVPYGVNLLTNYSSKPWENPELG